MTTAAIMAILRNLRALEPTIKPTINEKSITTYVGKPNLISEVMNSKFLQVQTHALHPRS